MALWRVKGASSEDVEPDGPDLAVDNKAGPASTPAINPTACAKPLYDAVKDFTPISSICVNPAVLAARIDMPDTVMGHKGSAPALNDMMSGQLAWMFDTFATMLPLHRTGKIRILGYAHWPIPRW